MNAMKGGVAFVVVFVGLVTVAHFREPKWKPLDRSKIALPPAPPSPPAPPRGPVEYDPIDRTEVPHRDPGTWVAPRAPGALKEQDPWPFYDDVAVAAEAKSRLKSGQTRWGKFVIANGTEKDLDGMLKDVGAGVRNEWRLRTRIAEKVTGFGGHGEAFVEVCANRFLSPLLNGWVQSGGGGQDPKVFDKWLDTDGDKAISQAIADVDVARRARERLDGLK